MQGTSLVDGAARTRGRAAGEHPHNKGRGTGVLETGELLGVENTGSEIQMVKL